MMVVTMTSGFAARRSATGDVASGVPVPFSGVQAIPVRTKAVVEEASG